MARVMFVVVAMALVGCGGGGGDGDGGDGQITLESAGVYKQVGATGGPSLRFLDPEPPSGYVGSPASLIVAKEGGDRVAYWTSDKGLLFVGKIRWRMDPGTSVGTIEGSGTAYGPTLINGGRTEMRFADGSTAAPATLSGQTVGNLILDGGKMVLQGDEFNPIRIGATFDASLDDASVTMAQIVGNYREAALENAPPRPPAVITVDNQGNVTGSDQGGNFTGKLTVVDSTNAIQRIELDYTPTAGGVMRHYSGIAGVGTPVGGPTGPFRGFGFVTVDPVSETQFSLGFVRT